MKYFITAIGTDCGKTLVSAIFCQHLKADYWKPVQTGNQIDSDTIRNLISFDIKIFPEAYLLKQPLSPHKAAEFENIDISLENFRLPTGTNHLIVEGAGGILVPLNDKGEFLIDFILKENLEIILVVKLYLGCINHALLSISELINKGSTIKGLVFNGDDNFGAIDIICKLSGINILLHIKEEIAISHETILKYAENLLLNAK